MCPLLADPPSPLGCGRPLWMAPNLASADVLVVSRIVGRCPTLFNDAKPWELDCVAWVGHRPTKYYTAKRFMI